MFSVELIAPCASIRDLDKVLGLPIDAIYVGIAGWSRANRGNEFNLKELKIATDTTHSLGKRIYLSFNLMPSPFETKMALKTLEKALECGIDAVIASDVSIIKRLSEWGCEVHASLGTSLLNAQDVIFYAELGAKRMVLSPNLSLQEIDEINRAAVNAGAELEIMVHGIKCIATYLGICRLSSFFDMIITNCGVRSLIWEGSAKRSGICFRPCAQEWFTDSESFFSLAPLTNHKLYSPLELATLGIRHLKIGGRGMPFELLKRIVEGIIFDLEKEYEKL